MPWSAAALKRYLIAFAVVAGCVSGAAFTSPMTAASSVIRAQLCDGESGSSITIENPSTDLVVDNPRVIIKGSVNHATQIEEQVDGSYNGTIPLDPGDTTFETTITLSEGTHTVELIANDVCNTQNASDSIVLTYTPKVIPGRPAPPDTTLGTEPSSVGNGGKSSEIITGTPNPISGANVGDIMPLERNLEKLGRALDFDSTGRDGPWKVPFRVGFIVVGSALAFAARWFSRAWVIRKLGLALAAGALFGQLGRRWTGAHMTVALRLIGLLMIIFAFFI